MTMNDTDLKIAEETIRALDEAKHVEPRKPEFWLWSDIANIHSSFLDVKHMIMPDYFHDILQKNVFKKIPEFKYMVSTPIHIKTISKENSNDTQSSDLDQKISRAGCEFIFQKYDNATLTQAYFMFPNKSVVELAHLADEISIYHAAKRIQNATKVLVAIITTKATDYVKEKTVTEVFNTLWKEFFNTTDIKTLKEKFGIKNTPTTHLIPNHWPYVYYMLQECVNALNVHNKLTTEEIMKQCIESAHIQRELFKRHTDHTPEQFLTPTNFKTSVDKIEEERKNLWLCYYPQTLRQR